MNTRRSQCKTKPNNVGKLPTKLTNQYEKPVQWNCDGKIAYKSFTNPQKTTNHNRIKQFICNLRHRFRQVCSVKHRPHD